MKKVNKYTALIAGAREISFVATMVGALLFFSEVLHLTVFENLSNKLGVSFDVFSWTAILFVMFLMGGIARYSVKRKFDEEEPTKDEEDKKLSVGK